MTPARLIVLSGDDEALASSMRQWAGISEVEIVRLEEKDIVRFREMTELMRLEQFPAIAFGCKDLELQRYQFVLQTYLALSRSDSKFLLDSFGRKDRFSASKYLLFQVPRFLVELIASTWVVVYSWFRLNLLLIMTPRDS